MSPTVTIVNRATLDSKVVRKSSLHKSLSALMKIRSDNVTLSSLAYDMAVAAEEVNDTGTARRLAACQRSAFGANGSAAARRTARRDEESFREGLYKRRHAANADSTAPALATPPQDWVWSKLKRQPNGRRLPGIVSRPPDSGFIRLRRPPNV